jgi:hypothetical protein
METGPLDVKAGTDRFATMDEIQAALSFFPETFIPRETQNRWEVPSDLGGYILMDTETEDASILALLERLDTAAN